MSVLNRAALAGLVVVALWVVLTYARPGVTFHLAPVFVAAAPAVLARYERVLRRALALTAGGIGAAFALGATGALQLAGRLDGPSLLPTGGAALESIVFGLVGAVVGIAIAWPWPGQVGAASREG